MAAPPKNEHNGDQKVAFNFVDVDLAAITKFISEITKKNYIFDERVKGKITIITPSKLSIDEANNLFVSVLELKGYTVVPSGGDAYKIVPLAEAKQKGIRIAKDTQPVNDSYIARLIKLKNISSDDAFKLLQPVISRDGYISAFGPGNMLLVIDSGLNIEKALSIIEAVDRPYASDEPETCLLKFSSADAVARILNDGLSRRPRVGMPAGAEEAKAIADTRLNAVILFGDRGVRESMKSLIKVLDVPSPDALGRINVFFLENADAVELAKVLDGMLKGSQAAKLPGAPVTPFEAAGGITITPDKATNSLVIVASPADYQNLSQILKQLDRKRRQVYVEALIAEVRVDKMLDLGNKFRGSIMRNGTPILIGGVGSIDSSTFQSIITGMSGLTMGGMGKFFTIKGLTTQASDGTISSTDITAPGLAAIFSLSDFKGVVNVLSTPQILTSDNKEAEILVGENVPFISKRERDITTTNTVLNSIERQDVGVKLKITPQITEGDYIKLDIYQEISALINNQSENVLISVGPSISKRSTKTSVLVKDNETVVIGGLMEEKLDDSVQKAPLLGDIPLLGWLFKSKSTEKVKTNLMVFITPHMVKEAEGLARITRDKQGEFYREGKSGLLGAEEEILVRLKQDMPMEKALALISQKGASVVGYSESSKTFRVKPKAGQDMEETLKTFEAMPEVRSAEPRYKLK
ncbi:MAG TPA: type II secretion system secretin GspD [Dissulfurispiraceae bacterium]